MVHHTSFINSVKHSITVSPQLYNNSATILSSLRPSLMEKLDMAETLRLTEEKRLAFVMWKY